MIDKKEKRIFSNEKRNVSRFIPQDSRNFEYKKIIKSRIRRKLSNVSVFHVSMKRCK